MNDIYLLILIYLFSFSLSMQFYWLKLCVSLNSEAVVRKKKQVYSICLSLVSLHSNLF